MRLLVCAPSRYSARSNFHGPSVAREGRHRRQPFSPTRTRSADDPVPASARLNVVREPTPAPRKASSSRTPLPTERSPAAEHETRVRVRSGRRRAGMLAGCPFVSHATSAHSPRLASQTRERLTRSRSPIDRKPSPPRPSGFHRSSSYCHHDKHTPRLHRPSRAGFHAHGVAPLPVDARANLREGSGSAPTADDRSADQRHPFSRPHD